SRCRGRRGSWVPPVVDPDLAGRSQLHADLLLGDVGVLLTEGGDGGDAGAGDVGHLVRQRGDQLRHPSTAVHAQTLRAPKSPTTPRTKPQIITFPGAPRSLPSFFSSLISDHLSVLVGDPARLRAGVLQGVQLDEPLQRVL